MPGRNFNVFLLDGTSGSTIKYSAKNLTILAYKIPRSCLDSCKGIAALKQTGVYFLFGKDDETDKSVVYVGQAVSRKNGEGLLGRLMEHRRNPNKDYWTHAVCFTTTDDTLGPTEISYLENRFCNMAKDAGRYIVKNGNDPNNGNISEETRCEMEEYVKHAELIMSTLVGHDVFIPMVPDTEPVAPVSEEKAVPLFCTRKETNAIGFQSASGFVVKKGAMITRELTSSCPEYTRKLREKWWDKVDEGFRTTEDLLFSSPSAAANFICGASCNGNDTWKTEDGMTLKELEK